MAVKRASGRRGRRRSLADPERLKRLPSVDALLGSAAVSDAARGLPRPLAVAAVREVVARWRTRLRSAGPEVDVPATDLLASEAAADVRRMGRPSLRRVLNATGTLLHTNLGRAPLPAAAIEALTGVAASYSNLELDLDAGARGSRHAHVEALLRSITGAEAAMAVNNNAAAVVLALNTLAEGRSVVVSRGELVEIGGGFRIPEIIGKSGARLCEVGTTNRTRLADYRRALARGGRGDVAAILKVHASNFRIVGFTEETPLSELSALARKSRLPLVYDLGSGSLADLAARGIPGEPSVRDCLRAGADVVTFSGDKLLGGPQAGIVVGRRRFVMRMQANPMTRMLRVDKLTVAALQATLRLYLEPARALKEVPVLRALLEPSEDVRARAERLAALLPAASGAEVVPSFGEVGGGALPGFRIPGFAVAIRSSGRDLVGIERALRAGEPAVLARIEKGRLLLDCRTLSAEEIAPAAGRLHEVLPPAGLA